MVVLSDIVEWRNGQPFVVADEPDRELPNVYVVVMSQWALGDLSGVSVSADEGFFAHVSSDRYWLMADTTIGFGGERRDRFYAAFPNGFRRVLVDLRTDDMPESIAHHFEYVGADAVQDHPASDAADAGGASSVRRE